MQLNPSFKHFTFAPGLLYDDSASKFPSRLYGLTAEGTFHFNPGSTYFVYQFTGLSFINATVPLKPGQYAMCTTAQEYIQGDAQCNAIIIERIGTEAMFTMGGPIEDKGRLRYIDGCSDSLLIAPWKYGEPCLNHLHFPAYINQTPHTHPSIRIGMVVRGYGECITPWGNIPLTPGMIFAILPENGQKKRAGDGKLYDEGTHSFRTLDSHMDVIAFHPDSDYGPRDEEHPMINRTIVNGVSAKHLTDLQTKEIL